MENVRCPGQCLTHDVQQIQTSLFKMKLKIFAVSLKVCFGLYLTPALISPLVLALL